MCTQHVPEEFKEFSYEVQTDSVQNFPKLVLHFYMHVQIPQVGCAHVHHFRIHKGLVNWPFSVEKNARKFYCQQLQSKRRHEMFFPLRSFSKLIQFFLKEKLKIDNVLEEFKEVLEEGYTMYKNNHTILECFGYSGMNRNLT